MGELYKFTPRAEKEKSDPVSSDLALAWELPAGRIAVASLENLKRFGVDPERIRQIIELVEAAGAPESEEAIREVGQYNDVELRAVYANSSEMDWRSQAGLYRVVVEEIMRRAVERSEGS